MINYERLSNGKVIKINLFFCRIRLAKTLREYKTNHSRPSTILQINRFESGYCDFFIKFYKFSFTLNSLKVNKGKRYHKTMFKS